MASLAIPASHGANRLPGAIPWQPERNETVTISKRLYARLTAADYACQRTMHWISYRPMRTIADAEADSAARTAALTALVTWQQLTATGGPR